MSKIPESLQYKVRTGERGTDYHTVWRGDFLVRAFYGESSKRRADDFVTVIELEQRRRR